MTTIEEASQAVRRGPDHESVKRAARFGMAARGLIYFVVGLIALQIAWDEDQANAADREGAVDVIAHQPFGRLLLIALAAGFAGYIAWRGAEALWGRPDESVDEGPKAVLKRAASVGKALVYVALLATTVRIIVSGQSQGGSGDKDSRAATARALDLPAGRLLVGGVGVALFGVAVYFIYRGVARRFQDRLDTTEMGPVMGRLVDTVGTLGMAARGLIVGVLGWLVLRAALDFDPDEAAGVDGTLRRMAQQPYGQVLLTVTAVGILAFALYCFAEARYREV